MMIMMSHISTRPLLVHVFVSFLVILNSQLVFSVDLDRQGQVIVEKTPKNNQLKHDQLKKSHFAEYENEKDGARNEKELVDVSKKLRKTGDSINKNLRVRNFRRIEENDRKEKDEEEEEVPEDRSAANVVRPSYVLGRPPTFEPSTAAEETGGIPGILRPGSSFFAGETSFPTQSVKENQQSNPVIQTGIYRPGTSSSFVYPTETPSFSPVDHQILPAIPGINYIPRPGTSVSWQDGNGFGSGAQMHVADRPTRRPTPLPTTFPPIYVSAVNVPIGRPGTMLLPDNPSSSPTGIPSTGPSNYPTPKPTKKPTRRPTRRPTPNPTRKPTKKPSKKPTYWPTYFPTIMPSTSRSPTVTPSHRPTMTPTDFPTATPSEKPSTHPSGKPTSLVGIIIRPTYQVFTRSPTISPTIEIQETSAPSISMQPSSSAYPSAKPTVSMQPSVKTTPTPSSAITPAPSKAPVYQSLFDNSQGIARPPRPLYPTWSPTTFLPTVTYSPTVWVNWGAVYGRAGDQSDIEDDAMMTDMPTSVPTPKPTTGEPTTDIFE